MGAVSSLRATAAVVAVLAAGTATAIALGSGNADRAVGTTAARPASVAAPLPVRRAYAGVSCRQANRIGCDRIGLAVWLRRDRFEHVTARVGDRTIVLRRGRGGIWSGHLRDAGLRDGPLRVPASPTGRWIGLDPPTVRAVLDATRTGDSRATSVVATPLRAGWG
jgi:hypothetical protein